MEFSLLAAALTGVASAWLASRMLRWRGALGTDRPVDTLVVGAAAGMLSGRLAAMIGDGVNPLAEPASILIVRAGVDTGFATIGAMATLLWLFRRELPGPLDDLAPLALAGLAGWHGGCLWRDACLGTPSDLPWAWAQAGSAVTRHPVELYAALLLVLGSALLAKLPRRPWLSTGAALALAAAARLLTEPIRPSLTGGPVGWYSAGLTVGLAVMAVSFWKQEGGRRPEAPDKGHDIGGGTSPTG